MDLKQYIQDATRTESKIDAARVDPLTIIQVMSALVAAGRMLDQLKKNIYYTKPIKVDVWDDDIATIKHMANTLGSGVYLPLIQPIPLAIDPRVLHGVVGIATESTELIEAVLKSLTAGMPVDRVNLLEELGDIDWYHAILVDALDADWDKILNTNIEKLRARYPEKFTVAAAIDRNTDVERTILEKGDTND
jgi:NTP pyrophosphatase (non-canonical NTP hydrolase)